MNKFKIYLILALSLASQLFAANDSGVVHHQYPTGADQAFLSTQYKVYVKQNGIAEKELQVLMSDVNYRTMYDGDWMKNELKGRTFSFTQLDYDPAYGPLSFRVVKNFGTNATSITTHPKSYNLEITKAQNKEIQFKIDKNQKYISIHFQSADNQTSNEKWIKHMMTIFIDPPETNKPNPNGSGVVVYSKNTSASALANASTIYFTKGFHTLDDYTKGGPIDARGILTIKSGQSVYLEGGAFVEGIIARTNYNDSNQKVFGRGILTGRNHYWSSHPSYNESTEIRQLIELGQKAELSGIMYMESPNHGLTGRDVKVTNVKFLGWHSNHDGIRVGSGSEISNSFLRAVDDHFYNFNIHVHDCVIWAGHNGAILTYGWGGDTDSNPYDAGSSLIENIDIIHPEWRGLGNNNGLIMAQVGYNHKISDYGTGDATTIMRNIRVEGSIPGITNLKPRSDGSGNRAAKVKNSEVSFLGDLILENISVETQSEKGLIRGESNPAYDGNNIWFVKDVQFKNVSVGETCINNTNKSDFLNIEATTIKNISYTCNSGSSSSEVSSSSLPSSSSNSPVDPEISFISPIINESISGNYTLNVNAFDLDFGASHGDGITSVYYQILKVSDPSNALFFKEVIEAPFALEINTADFENGEYELRAGVQSEDFNATRKWTILKPITIDNTTPLIINNISDLSAQFNGCNEVNLNWSDVENEEAYRVRRRLSNETQYQILSDLAAGTTQYKDLDLVENTTYVYMVRPMLDNTAVAISNTISISVPPCEMSSSSSLSSSSIASSSSEISSSSDAVVNQIKVWVDPNPVEWGAQVYLKIEDQKWTGKKAHFQVFNTKGILVKEFWNNYLNLGNVNTYLQDGHSLITGVYSIRVSIDKQIVGTTQFQKK